MPGSDIISRPDGRVNAEVVTEAAIKCGFHMYSDQSRGAAEVRAPEFREKLLAWYDASARELPWRRDRDPYRVWVSEIMLQQTRVAAVIEHYQEFLRRFPTVQKLASARESSVLAAWSGLGYYRRARMLHAAAKIVTRERQGKLPATADGWRELPGIGRYTSAAIASIGFREPVAVVDGNVERVLQRVSGERLAGAKVWAAAERMLDRERPGDFNQAMMELGATVCTPRSPVCLMCPVVEFCATRGEMASPAKSSRQKKREIHYALDYREGEVFLMQRPKDASLMAGMWELPEISAEVALSAEEQIPPSRFASHRNDNGLGVREKKRPEALFSVKHSITVTDYTARVSKLSCDSLDGKWVAVGHLGRMPLTGLARKILRKAEILPH